MLKKITTQKGNTKQKRNKKQLTKEQKPPLRIDLKYNGVLWTNILVRKNNNGQISLTTPSNTE